MPLDPLKTISNTYETLRAEIRNSKPIQQTAFWLRKVTLEAGHQISTLFTQITDLFKKAVGWKDSEKNNNQTSPSNPTFNPSEEDFFLNHMITHQQSDPKNERVISAAERARQLSLPLPPNPVKRSVLKEEFTLAEVITHLKTHENPNVADLAKRLEYHFSGLDNKLKRADMEKKIFEFFMRESIPHPDRVAFLKAERAYLDAAVRKNKAAAPSKREEISEKPQMMAVQIVDEAEIQRVLSEKIDLEKGKETYPLKDLIRHLKSEGLIEDDSFRKIWADAKDLPEETTETDLHSFLLEQVAKHRLEPMAGEGHFMFPIWGAVRNLYHPAPKMRPTEVSLPVRDTHSMNEVVDYMRKQESEELRRAGNKLFVVLNPPNLKKEVNEEQLSSQRVIQRIHSRGNMLTGEEKSLLINAYNDAINQMKGKIPPSPQAGG